MRRSMKHLPLLLLVIAGPVMAQTRLPRTPKPKPTVVPAGPASLTAASKIPGQILLTFPYVQNAERYRVTRSSNAPEPEQSIAEGDISLFGFEGPNGGYRDAPVGLTYTYSYKVYAIFVSATGSTTVSTPSPTASAASVPFLQPLNLRFSVALSPAMRMVNVTLSWGSVANAEKYRITVEGRAQPYETSATSLLVSSVPAGRQYKVCVGTVYPYNLTNDASATCATVKT